MHSVFNIEWKFASSSFCTLKNFLVTFRTKLQSRYFLTHELVYIQFKTNSHLISHILKHRREKRKKNYFIHRFLKCEFVWELVTFASSSACDLFHDKKLMICIFIFHVQDKFNTKFCHRRRKKFYKNYKMQAIKCVVVGDGWVEFQSI